MRIGNTSGQVDSLIKLAMLLDATEQLDEAENAASRAIELATAEGEEHQVSRLHRTLGNILQSKGERKKAIGHFEAAISISSRRKWQDGLFWNHYELAQLLRNEGEFDEATAHIEQAKSNAGADTYQLGRAMELQATVWHFQLRLEESKLEALHALEIYEKLGATKDAGDCKDLLQEVERAMKHQSTSS